MQNIKSLKIKENRHKNHYFLIIAILLSLLTFKCKADKSTEMSLLRYRSMLFGMYCANIKPQKKEPYFNLKNITKTSLLLGNSLVKEGGLDTQVARSIINQGNANYNLSSNSFINAYQIMTKKYSQRGEQLQGLLHVVPVTLAYLNLESEALKGSAIAASLIRPENTELRGAGRAYCAVLSSCLKDNASSRKEALQKAREAAGSQAVEDALQIILTDLPIDPISTRPGEVLAFVLRAWYDSNSYQDAIMRLRKNSSDLQKAMLGALAGCTYGLSGIPTQVWPDLKTCQMIERLARCLQDLANDNILLPIRDYDSRPAPAPALQNQNTMQQNNIKTRQSTATAISFPAQPQIPSIKQPRMPVIPKPKISAADIPLFPKIKFPNPPKIPGPKTLFPVTSY